MSDIRQKRSNVSVLGGGITTIMYMGVFIAMVPSPSYDSSGEGKSDPSLLPLIMGFPLSGLAGGILTYCGYTIYHHDYFNLSTKGLFNRWFGGQKATDDIENKAGTNINENFSLLPKPTGPIN